MNEEVNINLLLDRLYTTGKIDKRYMWALKDYITNLQEENERLKEILHWKQIESNIFYKQRNEKAIEYIKNTHYYSEVINEEYLLKNELLNILKGEDKE